MKAIVYEEYGPPEVLKIRNIDKPVPGLHQILVKVKAASVNFGDLRARNFKNISAKNFHMHSLFKFIALMMFGFSKPKKRVLGSEFSGVVESVGSEVSSVKPGDHVFGYLSANMGAYQEYLCVDDKICVAVKPPVLSFEEAAVLTYGPVMAVGVLKNIKINPGDNVLILGASGFIGSAALQILKSRGAKVTGVCSKNKFDYVMNLGAENVIEYKNGDYLNSSLKYNLIVDILGKGDFTKCRNLLKPGGVHLFISFKTAALFNMIKTRFFGNKKVICKIAIGSRDDFLEAVQLIENGKIRTGNLSLFPADDVVDAHRFAEAGKNTGPVVLTFD
ncbi:MAG: NAD(P)-dependent alcohol dehydrogenase [Ignavibacteriaceae bacterium]|nr:NAD(P)-dependent alcohol dehydrogenase [Ignavibacteriaceae bacterium]